MHSTLFTIPFLPEGWGEVKSYGFLLMLGFLSGIWLACRRAMRVKADPDVVLNIGLISLLAGVAGARAYFVIHYWDTQFANQPSPLMAIFAINKGGLEFWGGPLLAIPCAMFYLWKTKRSIRWYLDIMAPSLMWGLAFGRMGCFLNGCCWGGVCVDPNDPQHKKPGLPWAITFPYGSPAMTQQYWFRQMSLPTELVCFLTEPGGEAYPIPAELLAKSDDELRGPQRAWERARQTLEQMKKDGADETAMKKQQAVVTAAERKFADVAPYLRVLKDAGAASGMTPSDLRDLASHYRSLPVQPVQLYGVVNALLISWVLALLFFRRERHGIVFGWMLILKAITRFLLELIRQDNPLDVLGLSVSQAVCIGMFAFGVLFLLIMRRLPLKSPHAIPYVPEDEEPVTAARPAGA